MTAAISATVLAALGTPNEWPYVAAAYLAVFVGIGAFALRTVIAEPARRLEAAAGEASMDVTDAPDDRDLDEGGLDLTPRTDRPVRRARKGNRWVAVGVLVVLGVRGRLHRQAGPRQRHALLPERRRGRGPEGRPGRRSASASRASCPPRSRTSAPTTASR